MAKDESSALSSAFDALLEKSRQEWDALTPGAGLTGPAAGARPVAAPVTPATSATPPAAPRPAESAAAAGRGEVLRQSGEYASAARVWDPARSEAAAFLFNRFGDGWQVEVAERRRDGDEFVVLVKLTVPGKNLVKSQFGRGRIPAPTGQSPIQGSAGGLSFSLGGQSPGGESGGPAQPPEERGYRRAIEDGLARCVELL